MLHITWGLEGPDAAECGLGTSQVLHTLQALNDYAGFIPACLDGSQTPIN